MKYSIAIATLTAAIGLVSNANAAEFTAGKDYRIVEKPDIIKSDVVVVREFFYYGCPHCYKIEPALEKWAATKAKDVAFFQSPAALNPKWINSAKGFYAAQLMGYQHKTHSKIFDAIFKEGNQKIMGDNEEAIIDWYASQGLDRDTFKSNFNSFAVNNRISRSSSAAQRYRLTGTPSVVVQGKYVINPASPEKTVKIVDFLVEKVRSDKKK